MGSGLFGGGFGEGEDVFFGAGLGDAAEVAALDEFGHVGGEDEDIGFGECECLETILQDGHLSNGVHEPFVGLQTAWPSPCDFLCQSHQRAA